MRHAFPAISILLTVGVAVASPQAQRTLTFEDRVAAQRAIEQVYWNHRIWPSENTRPKPSLSAVMSAEAIRAKVDDYLRKSDALEKTWGHPLTASELQAELDRMVSRTRNPGTLAEISSALGNDPALIAETLARQTLADRLIRSRYARDVRFHDPVRLRATNALAELKTLAGLKNSGLAVVQRKWRLAGDATDALSPKDWAALLARLGSDFATPDAPQLDAPVKVETRSLPKGTLSPLR
jgi:hypothetical protein